MGVFNDVCVTFSEAVPEGRHFAAKAGALPLLIHAARDDPAVYHDVVAIGDRLAPCCDEEQRQDCLQSDILSFAAELAQESSTEREGKV